MAPAQTQDDLVNIMVFEKDLDGDIKFDEYTSLSIDAAVELVLSAKAKDFARSAGKNDKNSRRLPASLPKMRPPRTRSPYQHSAGLSEPQSRRRRGGGRERDRSYQLLYKVQHFAVSYKFIEFE